MLYYRFPKENISHVRNTSLATLENGPHVTRTVEETIVYYLIEGRLHLQSGGEEVIMTPGDVHIFSIGEYQKPLKTEDCKYYFLHFFEDFERVEMNDEEAAEYYRTTQNYFLRSDYTALPVSPSKTELLVPKHFNIGGAPYEKQIVQCFKSANLSRFTPKDSFYTLFSDLKAAEIMLLLHRCQSEAALNDGGSFSEKTAREIGEYLNHHLETKFNGKNLERIFGYSFDHMNRRFKALTGKTIYAYLQNARIEQAKLLLYTQSTTVSEVAIKTGYGDIYHFSKAFKKITGMTPSEYMHR